MRPTAWPATRSTRASELSCPWNLDWTREIRAPKSGARFLFDPIGQRSLGLGHHISNPHRGAALALAFVGRFHERHDLDRLFGADRRLARPKELGDLHQQRAVASSAASRQGGDRVRAESGPARLDLAAAERAERAQAVSLPAAYDDVELIPGNTTHRFAACSHASKQRLNSVNAIPEQVWVRGLDRTRAICVTAQDFADLAAADLLHDRLETR
jgi:hypothetical protein